MAQAHFSHIVVGGGPAGATAAERIGRAKQKVLVIEKSPPHPNYRDKPCGGGLGPVTIKLFPFTRLQKVHETDRLKLTMDSGEVSIKIPIVMVNRNQFDGLLMDRAIRCGAKVHFGRCAKEIDLDKRVVTLDNGITISYEHLIGAGGISCPVARALGVKVKHAPVIVGKADGGKQNLSSEAEIRFIDGLNGYAWIFPKGKFLDVGIGGDAPMPTLQELLGTFLTERKLKLHDEVKWLVPYEPPWKSLIADETTILCGDAAGFVNPATGEGIRYAMQSGLEAAEVSLGARDITKYPSFGPLLGRLFAAREKIIGRGVGTNFEEMKNNPDLLRETVDFFFEDKDPPKRVPIADSSKLETYRKMLEAIQEEE